MGRISSAASLRVLGADRADALREQKSPNTLSSEERCADAPREDASPPSEARRSGPNRSTAAISAVDSNGMTSDILNVVHRAVIITHLLPLLLNQLLLLVLLGQHQHRQQQQQQQQQHPTKRRRGNY